MKYFPILFSIIFFSCSPEKQLNKLQINHPDLVCKKAAEWYPCVSIKAVSDSSQYKEFMSQIDSLNQLNVDTLYIKDTLVTKDTVVKTCKKILVKYREILKHVPAIHDTIKIIDQAGLIAKDYELKQMTLKADDYNNKYTKSLYYMSMLLLMIICLITYLYVRK